MVADHITSKTRVLVVGASGQLARSIALLSNEARSDSFDYQLLGRPDIDITDAASIENALDRVAPDIIVNASAYTAVDMAETEIETAFALNRDGPAALAKATASRDLPIIHVSTDYVFDGTKPAAYTEADRPNPQCVYGRSKYEGELCVAAANPRHIIIRTSWVYSEFGKNFVKTMLRLACERSALRVVADQYGNPTYAPDLANAIAAIIGNLSGAQWKAWGIFHLAGTGGTTWHGLAEAAVAVAEEHGKNKVRVIPIATSDYQTAASRPANSQLNCESAFNVFGVALPTWESGVRRCVENLMRKAG